MWQQSTLDQVQLLSWRQQPAGIGFPESAFKELEQLVDCDPHQRWVIDADGFQLLSSEAIALLIGVVRKVNLAGGAMCLARPMPSVAAVLRLTRLTKILPLFDELLDAVASLR
jgi:anti-anti-sigma factor